MVKTMFEILDETCKFYNTDTRSATTAGLCLYQGPDGKRCAFSRCVDEDSLSALRENEGVGDNDLKLLKPEYQGHPLEFWSDIQSFHDNVLNWTKDGLSGVGLTRREGIENSIKRGFYY